MSLFRAIQESSMTANQFKPAGVKTRKYTQPGYGKQRSGLKEKSMIKRHNGSPNGSKRVTRNRCTESANTQRMEKRGRGQSAGINNTTDKYSSVSIGGVKISK